jgi:hypothetical protein
VLGPQSADRSVMHRTKARPRYAYLPFGIYSALSGNNRTRQFFFALEVLAHLRDHTHLRYAETRKLCPGSYLRDNDRDRVLAAMEELGLLGSLHSKKGARLTKNLFPELLKVGSRSR